MEMSIRDLSPDVQQFIQTKLAEGAYRSPEELINTAIRQEAERSSSVAPPHKPSMGMFADRNEPITFEEIEEASQEACKNFPRDFPKGS